MRKENGVTKADNFVILDLRKVRGNSYQSRGMGVLPKLAAHGYGLFEKIDQNKPTLWSLLTAEGDAAAWQQAVALITEHHPDIKELADSILLSGQLHNIGITRMADGNGWDVVYGIRRCIAKAYNACIAAGELPWNIKAEIAGDISDPYDLHIRALHENKGRKDESPIDEAQRYRFLKSQGLSTAKIAERTQQNGQNIRNRLQLLQLTPQEQQRIHEGDMSQDAGLKLLQQRAAAAGGGPAAPETAANKSENRIRVPTKVQAEKILATVEKPKDMPPEEWEMWKQPEIRRFFAYFLKKEPTTYAQMVSAKKQEEKAALDRKEKEIRKAAEAAEAAEGDTAK